MRTLIGILFILFTQPLFSQTTSTLSPTDEIALIRVQVTDFDGKTRVGEKVLLESLTTKKIVSGITNEEGRLEVLLPEGDSYKIQVKGLGKDNDYDTFELPNMPGAIASEITIQYEWEEKVYTLDNVFFDTGKAALRPSSFPELDELAEALTIKPKLVIEIAGHTDNVGSDESNRTLSQNRAKSVRNYLIKKGIQAQRLEAKGYGEMTPVASNDTAEGRQTNRLTEVRILSE